MLLRILLLGLVCFFRAQETRAGIPEPIRVHIPPELLDLLLTLRGSCANKVGLAPDDIENFQMTPQAPQPYRCYMECIMTKAKWITPKGKLNYAKMLDNSLPALQNIMEDAVNKCRDINGADGCELAFNFNLCVHTADPTHYFLP